VCLPTSVIEAANRCEIIFDWAHKTHRGVRHRVWDFLITFINSTTGTWPDPARGSYEHYYSENVFFPGLQSVYVYIRYMF
jgi:hypothetical protein